MLKKIFILFIHLYQWIVSPLLPPSCRFYPSCSNYALQAIEKFGVAQGLFFSLKRLIKCNPWHPGGYDPVK